MLAVWLQSARVPMFNFRADRVRPPPVLLRLSLDELSPRQGESEFAGVNL